jgi:hypothetical protein
MPKIRYVENFIFWLAAEGKLIELLTANADGVPVIAESLDEYEYPYYNYTFIHPNQQVSEGNIKGDPIPRVQLHNGTIQNQDVEKVEAFIQSFGISDEIAAKVLIALEKPMRICLCSSSILNQTASSFAVTFNKNFHGDTIMWVRGDVQEEPDSLIKVEYGDARSHLPLAAELDSILRQRTIGHIAFDSHAQAWRG